ncbi:MAG: hypothetical protein LBU16_09785 [Treponema sp.]|jgi:hypothetical protein|nr:hypothetical protein [Treponema sp.]
MALSGNNVLNGLIPIIRTALDNVSRKWTGMLSFTPIDAAASMASQGQTVNVPKSGIASVQDIGDTPPVNDGKDFGTIPVLVNHYKVATPIVWNGEEEKGVGDMLNPMRVSQFEQRFEAIAMAVEGLLCETAVMGAIGAGNVYGVAGTPPFSGSLADMAAIAKIMDDISRPTSDRAFIGNSVAIRQFRSLGILTAADQNGSDTTLRTGNILPIFGFGIGQSGGFQTMAPGGGSGYVLNGAHPEGAAALTVDTGSGTLNKGEIIAIAGDPNKYIIVDDVPSGGTEIKIAGGLKKNAPDNAAITSGAAYLPSVAYARDALVLAARQPYMPEGGDEAEDVMAVTDTATGLVFQVAYYKRYRKRAIEIALAYGAASVNPEHAIAVLG